MWCTMAIGKRLVVKLSIASTDHRWGDEWLMGIAYGLAWLVQSGPLDGVSPEWHMIQLSMQNALHAYIGRIIIFAPTTWLVLNGM